MRTLLLQIVPLLVGFSNVARASLTPPGDVPYYRLRLGRTLYVYDAANRDLVADLAAHTAAFRARYDRSFGWNLDEEQSLMLISANAQVANAFAMQQPNLKSVWFGSGPDLLESAASSSWISLLSAHETAHLYQMNAKAPVSAALKSVFGNATLVSPLIWPVFLLPNQMLPLSFAEGNAVLNESGFGTGGRLHSGEERALVLRQVAAGRFDATRLINEQFRFPFANADYVLGGYFQAHLAGKYGVDRANAFFRAHAEHWLNPLRINATFREHFGPTFYAEVREATRGLERLAEHQAVTPGDWITPATLVTAMNHDAQRVWWMTNPGYRTYRLHVMTKADRSITSRDLNVLAGKAFLNGDRVLTAATFQNDLHHETYGLYGENARLAPEARGEIVTDVRAGHRVGFDARDAWRDPRILRDGEPYEIGHARPLLDEAGHVYFFRQHGPERLLYRDHQILTKFTGFYGKLTEISPAGEVFFIANTPFGSSLYRFANHEITRVVASDAVVDARILDDTHALVSEVDADGGHFAVAERIVQAERPAVYAYPFTPAQLAPVPVVTADAVARGERGYSGLRELKFSEASLGLAFSSFGGTGAGAAFTFTDPLEFNALTAGAFYSAFGTRTANAAYTYTRFLPHLYGQYTYGDYVYHTLDGHARAIDQEADVGVRAGLLRHQIYDASLNVAGLVLRRGADFETDRTRDEAGVFAGVSFERRIKSPLGLYPWRYLGLGLVHRALFETARGRSGERAGGVRVDWTHGFGGQVYLGGAARVAAADERSINVGYDADLKPTAVGVARLGLGPLLAVRSAGALRLEGRKVLNESWYDDRIPLGLNRAAVVFAAQATGTGESGPGAPKSIYEVGLGIDFDLLLYHQGNARTRVMFVRVSDAAHGDPDAQLVAGVSGSF